MTVTLKESRALAESAIEAILNIGPKLLCEWQQGRLSLNRGPVSVVASRERTGTMKITVSHWKSDGSAAPVTFAITPRNSGRGEAASRIKYCAKADSMDREEGMDGDIQNDHPTVKPVALMRYLCRLVTPPGGLILDPFAGSGTTLVAARREGFRSIGIERDKHYCEIGKARMSQGMLLFGAEEEG